MTFEEDFPNLEKKFRVQLDRSVIHHGGNILFEVKKSPCLILSTDIQKFCLDKARVKEAFEVIKSWGFTYKTVAFTWVKTTVNNKYHFGGGNWTRTNPEQCLLATKGKIKRISASVRNLCASKIREHSKKPDEIRYRITELVGTLPRIELFARQKTEGWDVWGNEVKSDIEL